MEDNFVMQVLSQASKHSKPAKSVIYKRVRPPNDDPSKAYCSQIVVDK